MAFSVYVVKFITGSPYSSLSLSLSLSLLSFPSPTSPFCPFYTFSLTRLYGSIYSRRNYFQSPEAFPSLHYVLQV